MSNNDNNLVQLASLWTREDKRGNKYLSGSLDPEGLAQLKRMSPDEVKVMVFKADQRGNNRAPTHRVYIARKQARGGRRRRDDDNDIGF